jgi:prephenate dehydrogenase
LLKQTRLFNNSLQALELMISSGRSDALEGLIRQASDARAGWRMNQTTK